MHRDVNSGKIISRKELLSIYYFAMKLRKEKEIGQRKISMKINNKFGITISESTISGWIHKENIPFANEITQFKSKTSPNREKLYQLYIIQMLSSSQIAFMFNVSVITVINWLASAKIKRRSHTESMNTKVIKKVLREHRLTVPKKIYSKITKEKSYILGVLAGDGHINEKFIRFEIRKDKEFIEEFSRCLNEVYGIKYKFKYYEPRNSYVLYVASQIICKDLLKFGDFNTYNWRVPKSILCSKNEEILGSYIRGIYDSEGSVGKYIIQITSVCKEGIEKIQNLLLRLGISSRLKQYGKYWYLNITGKENRKLFSKKVGFTIVRKQQKLQ